MSANAFYFALSLPPRDSADLLKDLVARVCSTAACGTVDTAELVREVEEAVAKAGPKGECEVRFEARDGALGVTVHSGSRQIWQTSRPID